ncbi:hypothetical protein B1T51_21435 [Mycobacterium kansasii]|nr:hypothetical protein B1T51_21435 [Mycobacterium kansasii]
MEFLTLPPEVNSARILRGPGPAPLRAAATAWATLSEDLASSATAVSSVMSEISGSAWQGPAAAAMAAAVAPYSGGVGAAAARAAGGAAPGPGGGGGGDRRAHGWTPGTELVFGWPLLV